MSTLVNSASDEVVGHKLESLREAVEEILIGQPYLFARESYKSELTVHFGTTLEYSVRGSTRTMGSHVLSLRASAWMLHSGIQNAVVSCMIPIGDDGNPRPHRSLNASVLESGSFVKSGSTIERIATYAMMGVGEEPGVALKIILSDGSVFDVLPSPSPPDETLSDWELLSPSGLLRVGPGLKWRIDRSR